MTKKIVVKESFYSEDVGLSPQLCFKKDFISAVSLWILRFFFFRQAILQHTSKQPYLAGSLALYETAEAK